MSNPTRQSSTNPAYDLGYARSCFLYSEISHRAAQNTVVPADMFFWKEGADGKMVPSSVIDVDSLHELAYDLLLTLPAPYDTMSLDEVIWEGDELTVEQVRFGKQILEVFDIVGCL